jgi:hypothetical protein
MGKFSVIIREQPFSLIASLPANDPALARAAWDQGADAVKVHINVGHRASGVRFGSFAEEAASLGRILAEARGPVGIVLGGDPESAGRDLGRVIAEGFDFVSIYAHHAPASLLGAGIDRMLAAEYSYDLEEARALGALADIFEASIVPPESYGEPLLVRDLARYRRLAGVLEIPLVAPTQKRIVPADVAPLRRAGVRALMIGAVSAGKSPGEFGAKTGEFKKAVEASGGAGL